MADLKDYAARVTRLNVNRAKGSPSPHKPCLLLAVIDLIDDSETPTNRSMVKYKMSEYGIEL